MFPDLGAIKRRREALGITQVSLAERVECSQPYLGKIERAKVVPNYVLAGRIFTVLETEEHRGDKTVNEVMHSPVICFEGSQTAADAAKKAKEEGMSQFPILRRGRPVGSITTRDLIGIPETVQLGRVMGSALPSVPPGKPISAVKPLLRHHPAVIVLDRDQIQGIVTAEDLL